MYLMGRPDSFGFIDHSVEVRLLMFSGYFMYVFPVSVRVSSVTQSHVVSWSHLCGVCALGSPARVVLECCLLYL